MLCAWPLPACGASGRCAWAGTKERYSGTEHGTDSLIEKSRLEIVTRRDQVDFVVQIIAKTAHTARPARVSATHIWLAHLD